LLLFPKTETYTFEELVRLVARAVGRRARLVMAGLVATEGPPTGATRLSEWLDEHAADVGTVYASGLARHYR
jgi:hypothetical protein